MADCCSRSRLGQGSALHPKAVFLIYFSMSFLIHSAVLFIDVRNKEVYCILCSFIPLCDFLKTLIYIKQIPFLAPQYEVGGAYAIPLAIVDLNYLDAGSGVGFRVVQNRFDCWKKMLSWPSFMVHVTANTFRSERFEGFLCKNYNL